MPAHKDGYSVKLTDEELAEQATKDLNNREQELAALDRDHRKLVHKLNKALG